MAWVWVLSMGELISPEGEVLAKGYSGHGDGVNNPGLVAVHDVGPIPPGKWYVSKFFNAYGRQGPLVADLIPANGTQTFGRNGFMIHGDNHKHDHSASEGCIVLPEFARAAVEQSADRELEVVDITPKGATNGNPSVHSA